MKVQWMAIKQKISQMNSSFSQSINVELIYKRKMRKKTYFFFSQNDANMFAINSYLVHVSARN